MILGILLILLLALSGFFSGAEVALLSVSKVKVRTFVREKRRGSSALQRLKQYPRRMIITILIGNNVVNISAAAITTVLATEHFGSVGVGVATGLLTAAVLIFGEITPKTLAARYATIISLRIAPTILGMGYALFPLVRAFEWFTGRIERLFKSASHDGTTEADIKTLVQFGVEENVVAPHEQFIINRALAFSDSTARAVMIPEASTFMLPADASIEDSFSDIISSGFSRIPIYEGDRTNVIGLVYIKNIAKEIVADWGHERMIEIAVPPIIIPEMTRIDYLFRIFQKQHMHMAIVHDRQQRTIGIVTLEDLIEELVGEIHDESDKPPSA